MTAVRLIASVVATALITAGCGNATAPVEATSHASPTSGSQQVPDTDGVLARFTHDIWPAVNAWNGSRLLGSPEETQQNHVIDPATEYKVRDKLRQSIGELGTVQAGDGNHLSIVRDAAGLNLASTSLTRVDSSMASVHFCYTYTANTFPDNDVDHPVGKPGASEADAELHKTDNWYLYAITNDQVVQGCSASPKA